MQFVGELKDTASRDIFSTYNKSMATISKTFSMLILMLICTTRKRNLYFINVKTRNPIKRLLEVISCSLILKKNPKRFQEETIVLKLDSPVLYEMFRHTHTHTHTSHLLMLVFTLALFPGFFFHTEDVL